MIDDTCSVAVFTHSTSSVRKAWAHVQTVVRHTDKLIASLGYNVPSY